MPDKSNRFRDLQIACAILGTNISALSREWGVSDTWIKTVAEGRGKSGNIESHIQETVTEAAELLPSSFLQNASNAIADSNDGNVDFDSGIQGLRQLHSQINRHLSQLSGIISNDISTLEDGNIDVVSVLQDINNRIEIISQVHDQLSNQDSQSDLLRIDSLLSSILPRFKDLLTQKFDDANVRLDVHCDKIKLPASKATHCTMLIHELVSNALQEAMGRDVDPLTISIHLEQQGSENVIGKVDAPVGMLNETIESSLQPENGLIEHFIDKLGAQYSLNDDDQAHFKFQFPIP